MPLLFRKGRVKQGTTAHPPTTTHRDNVADHRPALVVEVARRVVGACRREHSMGLCSSAQAQSMQWPESCWAVGGHGGSLWSNGALTLP